MIGKQILKITILASFICFTTSLPVSAPASSISSVLEQDHPHEESDYNDGDLACPTIGTDAFIMVTITENMDTTAFYELLLFYSKLMPINESISYSFYFGPVYTTTIVVKNLQEEIEDWKQDADYFLQLFISARTQSNNEIQYDDPNKPLSTVMRNIFHIVANQNQQPATAIKKKQVVILTDYVPVNSTEVMNECNTTNTQLVALDYSFNISDFQTLAKFPVYPAYDGDGQQIWDIRRTFQRDLQFEFPSVYQDKPRTQNYIFMSSLESHEYLLDLVTSHIFGSMCSMSDTKMYQKFIQLSFPHNSTMNTMTLPWIGDETYKFLTKCVQSLPHRDPADPTCSIAEKKIYQAFVSEATFPRPGNTSFVSLLANDPDCAAQHIVGLGARVQNNTYVRIILANNLTNSYDDIIKPLTEDGYISSGFDNQIISQSTYYVSNYTTTCVRNMSFVPLVPSTPYHRPKYLRFALDDMLWITICSSISVTTFGTILYLYVKRAQKKQMILLTEVMMSPRLYKAPDDVKSIRLPWEIKSDRLYIDKEFILGEGTLSNVYLGKLKGKAPIMQWIDNRVEMRQYQDCAVAVRVPFHFDEPEEDQLFREINSMKRLRHHDHIALLLGWTNKNDLVCSVLELTHMNLIKYLGQISETMTQSTQYPEKYMPYQVIYKIICEICDGMAFIHSRNLVHRDLTARNILLTTGLRAKISGFGFCSEPDDPKFSQNSVAYRFLPVRWMAPETFKGKFVLKSDIWSFAVLLYEIFTVGDVPYEDISKPEEIMNSVVQGRIPSDPKYANKRIYKIMQSCFRTFSDRRPTFNHLKEFFTTEAENFYDNQAFEPD